MQAGVTARNLRPTHISAMYAGNKALILEDGK
jgi:hypothetical protein